MRYFAPSKNPNVYSYQWIIQSRTVRSHLSAPRWQLCARCSRTFWVGNVTHFARSYQGCPNTAVQSPHEQAKYDMLAANRGLLRSDAYCQNNASCPFHADGRGSVPKVRTHVPYYTTINPKYVYTGIQRDTLSTSELDNFDPFSLSIRCSRNVGGPARVPRAQRVAVRSG